MQKKTSLVRRIIRTALMALLTVVLLAAFYIAVIMGDPQGAESSALTARQDQPLVSALPSALLITSEGEMGALLEAFPAPMMAAMRSTVLTFEKGVCRDVAFEDGLGRIVTLTYRTADGSSVTVSSIYPARALSLLEKGDYVISGLTGLPLAGLRSVRMETASTVRLHAQGSDALYAVTLPSMSDVALRTMTSTLQLYQGE